MGVGEEEMDRNVRESEQVKREKRGMEERNSKRGKKMDGNVSFREQVKTEKRNTGMKERGGVRDDSEWLFTLKRNPAVLKL